jgi:hypothetical protein
VYSSDELIILPFDAIRVTQFKAMDRCGLEPSDIHVMYYGNGILTAAESFCMQAAGP